MIEINKIYNMDCFDLIGEIYCNENIKIDLTITSPNYNIDLGNNKYKKNGYDECNDNIPYDKYLKDMQEVLYGLYTITKNDGRLAWNIGDSKNGEIPIHSDIIRISQYVGWKPYSIIIWDKMNTSNRAAWGSYLSCSCPSFPRNYEYILLFYKKNKKKIGLKENITIAKEEFIEWANGYWRFSGETNKEILKNHPAPFPEELPKRLIRMLSYKNDLIFDPFNGIGTTTLVAEKEKRSFIGCDISKNYCNFAEERLK